jgi:hypothetical protein
MSDALAEAQELYRESLDALHEQRRQVDEDLDFSDPSAPNQWDEDVKRQREADPGGKRPCLVMDQTGQYVANVAGQIEQQPPSLHAIPVGGGADKKAAEQLDGRFRHIEYASRASQHYQRALTSAARAGVGYMIVQPEYVDRALNYQEPRITSEPDPLKVVFDPWSTELDGSDATFGFVLSDMSQAIFKRKWPKKDVKDFGDREEKDDDRKSVLVARYWKQETQNKNVVVYIDENGQEASDQVEDADWYEATKQSGLPLQYVRSYTDKATVVKWCMMSGADILEESEYPASMIGIIPVYGYVGYRDGRITYCGIPRRARAPQQAYNYHMSEQLAYIGTAPRSTLIAPVRAIAGLETIWDRASTEQRAYLPYHDVDESGQPVNAPFRPNISVNLQNHEIGAQSALRDIQASIGMYQANLGAPSNETSGIAIESRKQQGEASTAHFPSHMAASLGHVGKIVMEMDARLMDEKRKAPIIGIDMSAGSVTVDPNQRQAFVRGRDGVTINPNVGKYGVRVVVGASYSTQRTQTNQAFGEIMRSTKDPALAAAVMPFWAQTLDFPGADKFAQAAAAMAPPAVKAILQPEGNEEEVDPATMAQQLAECKQALKEAIKIAEEAQNDADTAIENEAAIKRDKEIDQYKAETDRLKVTGANEQQIQAITQELVNNMLGPVVGQMDQMMNPPEPQEPEMPPEPAPEIVALAQGQEQIAASQEQIAAMAQQIAQGQQSLADMLQELAALTKRTRKRIPVRDREGNITEVIDRMDDDPQPME